MSDSAILRQVERQRDREGNLLPGADFMFWCPACQCGHGVWVRPPNKVLWIFKGTMERPTFEPSLKMTTPNFRNVKEFVCHLEVKDGVLHFCPDCTHELAGRQIPMEPF